MNVVGADLNFLICVLVSFLLLLVCLLVLVLGVASWRQEQTEDDQAFQAQDKADKCALARPLISLAIFRTNA